jgi:hypothetical protein
MLSMTAALATIKGRAAQAVPVQLIERLSRAVGHRWRDRDLGPVVACRTPRWVRRTAKASAPAAATAR